MYSLEIPSCNLRTSSHCGQILHEYYELRPLQIHTPQFPRIHDAILADTQTSQVRPTLEPITYCEGLSCTVSQNTKLKLQDCFILWPNFA
jgi:hypothetical protein